MSLRVQWLVPFFVPRTLRPPWLEIYGLPKYWINSRLVFWKIISELITNRGRHGTRKVSQKIFSPRERVPESSSPRDSPPKFSPGILRPANSSPRLSPPSRIFSFFWVSVPVPNPGFSVHVDQPRKRHI